MIDQNPIPWVLKRRFLVTLLAGIGTAAVSLVIFLLADDYIILVLGGVLLICCAFRSRILWKLISDEHYETVQGVCTGISSPTFWRYRKIYLLDGYGAEFTLLLDRNARFHIGVQYCFYFQKETNPLMGMPYLDAVLSTNAFLGYEEVHLMTENPNKK